MKKKERIEKRRIEQWYIKNWGFSPLFESGEKTVKPKLRKALKIMKKL